MIGHVLYRGFGVQYRVLDVVCLTWVGLMFVCDVRTWISIQFLHRHEFQHMWLDLFTGLSPPTKHTLAHVGIKCSGLLIRSILKRKKGKPYDPFKAHKKHYV